jgi:predicted Rossmann fold nucleotide-binding protein DprA/Smf involved in DNA uptake
MGVIPKARHFPSRNRLISGLCSAVIIVEAASKSGSLITARDALDQGREVLAVPGHPFDARAAGCNMLLRDGAVLVRSVDDVVQVLNAAENEPAFAEPVSQVTQNISQIIPSEAIKNRSAAYARPQIYIRKSWQGSTILPSQKTSWSATLEDLSAPCLLCWWILS